jgi:hypothetical protein
MSRRRCAFTGLKATTKNKVVPPEYSEEIRFNWSNSVPCSEEYSAYKQGRMPDELELKAAEFFYLMETYRLKYDYYMGELRKIQNELVKRLPPKKQFSNKKIKSIEKAHKLKEVLEESEKYIDETLNKEINNLWGD